MNIYLKKQLFKCKNSLESCFLHLFMLTERCWFYIIKTIKHIFPKTGGKVNVEEKFIKIGGFN